MNFRQLAASFTNLLRRSFLPHAETRAFHHTDFQDARYLDDASDNSDITPKVENVTGELGVKGMSFPQQRPEFTPPARATQEKIKALEKMLDQKKFTHHLGNFDGMEIEINSSVVPASDIKHYPATKNICAHFSVEHDDTVFVFWNNPSEEQKKIHDELNEKSLARKGQATSSYVDLTDLSAGGIGRISLKTERNTPYVAGRRAEAALASSSQLGKDWRPRTGTHLEQEKPKDTTALHQRVGFLGPYYE